MIYQGVELNEHFASLVRGSRDFELVTTPSLALSVFRLKLPSTSASSPDSAESLAAFNDLNRALNLRVSAHNDKLFITQTMLNGMICLRFAIGAQRSEKEHVDRAWDLIKQCAKEVVEEWTRNRKS